MQRRTDTQALVREYLGSRSYRNQDRIPPERELSRELGLTRAQLRTTMKQLETEGVVWRQVGKGTFFGCRPLDASMMPVVHTTPREMVEARITIESHLARLAALNATDKDMARIRDCADRGTRGRDTRSFQSHNASLHLAIAEAAHNAFLLAMYMAMNSSRYKIIWAQLMKKFVTEAHQEEYARQHAQFVEAICRRDADRAELLMRRHLEHVRRQLFGA